uniref:Uncharacterized protein n=1 Tax=Coccidioides posadasii RMSCC 3488 TaxID=454284 RepID=A0A0J6I3Q6_COCPO|nr:hypothetical protein CPAG_02348 [Coccidioides posadasii RMSCC 3488]
MRDARLGGPSNSSAVKRQRSEERSDDEDDNQPSKKSRTGCDDSKNGINKYDVSSPSRSLKLTRASTTPNLTQKQLSSGMVLRRPAENSHSNPSSSNSTSQQSSFSTTHRTAAQSSRSSSAAPVPPKPIPTAASIPPNGNTDNNGCDSHTHSHPDVLSEARLQGLTDKDWLYILSRAQAYSGEKLRADNLVAKETRSAYAPRIPRNTSRRNQERARQANTPIRIGVRSLSGVQQGRRFSFENREGARRAYRACCGSKIYLRQVMDD